MENTTREWRDSKLSLSRGSRRRKRLLNDATSKINPVAVGLRNVGDTCFINAVLQFMYSCQLLRQRLQQVVLISAPADEQEATTMSRNQRLCLSLSFLFEEMDGMNHKLDQNSNEARDGGVLDTLPFVEWLRFTFDDIPVFSRSGQQDAHEFFIQLLHECEPLGRIFAGEYSIRTRCLECETETQKKETFATWSISMSGHRLISEAVATQTEHLEGCNKYRCGVCRIPTEARRTSAFDILPSYFAVHAHHGVLGQVELEEKIRIEATEYVLHSIIVYARSSITAGHYLFYRRQVDAWLCCNDDQVQYVLSIESQHTPFLLFYSKLTQ